MTNGDPLTQHEVQAVVLYAKKCRKDGIYWEPVRQIERGFWYDFADPATGTTGQCKMGDNWQWQQAPLGEKPVILRLLGAP